jgi:two-component system response regulator AtoC
VRVVDLPATGTVTIGRGEGNVVRLDDPSVSRQHAKLLLDTELWVEDLGGANGTFLRDVARSGPAGQTQGLRRLTKDRTQVAIGDSLVFGSVSAVIRHAPDGATGFPELDASGGSTRGVVVLDPSMKALYAQADRAAQALISVLLLGETGVGKEVLARAIHARSPRAKGPFIAFNCAALSETLLEGELFGHERGAFTGATQTRVGLFEAADGGSVFLDEVGELPLSTQAKLLRVLEDRSVVRVGARTAKAIDVRFISATNRDLEQETRGGRFRQDLFFRLNGIALTIPPLRQRPAELEALVGTFVSATSRQLDREPLRVSPAAMQLLRAHDWPGNVRELRNVIERAVVLCTGEAIAAEHLPAALQVAKASPLDRGSFDDAVRSLERGRIVEALNQSGGNQTQAAKLLGISRRTLVTRLGELDLPRPRKRSDEE